MRPIAAVFLLVLCGCSVGGSDSDAGPATITKNDVSKLVLQPTDVPRVFVQFDGGRQISADTPGGERSDPSRFGRQDGWKARFRRGGSPQTKGPLVIESRADLFETVGGAKDELDAHRSQLEEQGGGVRLIKAEELGDESFVSVLEQQAAGSGGVTYYLIAWREDNVTASVLASGFGGRFTLEDALRLARRQERRTAAAAAG